MTAQPATKPDQGERSGSARRAGLLTFLLLGGLAAVPPLASDMYLPALPDITGSLDTSAASVQLTLTACLTGMALGQLLVGPMSDRWGRRRPLLAGLAVYVVCTVLCALAPTVELLVVVRSLQGLAGAAAVVIGRAVTRDLYDGVALARVISSLLLVSGLAPIVAPVVGGQLLRVSDWRGVFALLAVLGLLLTGLVWARLPETLPPAERHSGGVGVSLRAMGGLLTNLPFTGFMLVGAFSFATVFAYISAYPFVVQDIYGASPQTFSLLYGACSLGLVAVAQVNGRLLVGRVRLEKVLATGLVVVVIAATALLLIVTGAFGRTGLAPVAITLFVLVSAMGVALPNAQSLALLSAQHGAGSASALLGASSYLIGSLTAPLVGISGEDTAAPLAVVQLGTTLAALACFVGMCRPWRASEGEAENTPTEATD